MCGIAGYYRLHGHAEESVLRAMCDRIRHRGPDDDGYHVEGGCGIGMRRLSIIDLHTGHQPISNEDGSIRVVFNGEIYNYKELRGWLESRGHRFATHSDTETLVHLYEEEGAEGVARLRGMFAFAIWDSKRRRILLARDRFGKKPLYYAALPEGLVFGSELKCLRTAGVPLDLDEEALRLYFHFGYIPEPRSPFTAVKKLSPGGWLLYENGQVQQGRYWRLPDPAETAPGFSEQEAMERLRELFDEAVRIRMVADVPLGAFLSGGIDSTSVVASMAAQSSAPVKTFSIGFEEASFSELPYADIVARRYGTEHHPILLRPNAVELVHKLVSYFDEPFSDSSAIPTFLVSEFARQHVKVALSGDGGDELFAGYPSLTRLHELRRWDPVPGAARKLLGWVGGLVPYSAYGKNYLRAISRETDLERYFEWGYAPHYLRERLLRAGWMHTADTAFLTRTFADCLPSRQDADLFSKALYFEATAKLTGDMLVKVDRMSMAASLEVRCPLLDHVLAEFAFSLPPEWKVREGRGKHILSKAMDDRIPEELKSLPKKGFGIPLRLWFRGPLRPMLNDVLLSKRALERDVFSREFVQYLLDEHQSGRRDNSGWLWRLLAFELWMAEHESTAAETWALQNAGSAN